MAVQEAFWVVSKLSVSTPVNTAGFITPVHESGQINLKHTLKLMAPVLVQANKLLMVMVSWLPMFVILMHPGRLAAQDGS